MTLATLALPHIHDLVARQVEIQDDIERGAIEPATGKIYIENISRIITSTEVAEQASLGAAPEDFEATFNPEFDSSEPEVRKAMLAVYSDLESGQISSPVALARIRALDAIMKSFKSAAAVEIKLGISTPLSDEVASDLDRLGERIRTYQEQINFAVKELARLSNLPAHLVLERIKTGKGLDMRLSEKPRAAH